MAQLKDLLVAGPSRLIGDTYTTNLQVKTLLAPSTSGGTAYGAGENGQVLMSNGTSSYWGSASSINGMGNYVTLNTAQTITGAKTFSGANGFTYSGIAAASDNADRVVWFAYNGVNGRPVYDNNFKYNPSTNNLTVGKVNGFTLATETVGSASAGTAIKADDITAWTTNTPTSVTKKTVVTSATFNTVVTGGTTTDIPNISKKTVVTSASGATSTYSNGVLTLTNGSFETGDSVTVGTAIKGYTSLTTGVSGSATTGDSVSVTAGTAATLTYTEKTIPNISVTSKTVLKSTT